MSGPIILLILFVAGFILVKYRELVKDSFSSIVQVAKTSKETSAASSSTDVKGDDKKSDQPKWFESNLVTVVLVLVGAAIFFWGLYTPGLSLNKIGSWSWNHWFWLLIFWGILAALIAINAKALKAAAGTLQWVLAIAMFFLFIGIPGGLLVRDALLPTITCPDASAGGTLGCVINVSWIAPLKAANEPDVVGKSLCYTPKDGVEFRRIVNSGGSFWQFRAKEGEVLLRYKLMSTCPDELL